MYDDRESTVGAIDDLFEGHLTVEAIAIGIGNPVVRFSIGPNIATRIPAIAMPHLVHPSVIMDETSCALRQGMIVRAGAIVAVNVTV